MCIRDRVGGQRLQGEGAPGQLGKARAADQNLVEGHQRDPFQVTAGLGRGGNDGKVYLTVFYRLHGLQGGVVRDAQPDAGVRCV